MTTEPLRATPEANHGKMTGASSDLSGTSIQYVTAAGHYAIDPPLGRYPSEAMLGSASGRDGIAVGGTDAISKLLNRRRLALASRGLGEFVSESRLFDAWVTPAFMNRSASSFVATGSFSSDFGHTSLFGFDDEDYPPPPGDWDKIREELADLLEGVTSAQERSLWCLLIAEFMLKYLGLGRTFGALEFLFLVALFEEYGLKKPGEPFIIFDPQSPKDIKKLAQINAIMVWLASTGLTGEGEGGGGGDWDDPWGDFGDPFDPGVMLVSKLGESGGGHPFQAAIVNLKFAFSRHGYALLTHSPKQEPKSKDADPFDPSNVGHAVVAVGMTIHYSGVDDFPAGIQFSVIDPTDDGRGGLKGLYVSFDGVVWEKRLSKAVPTENTITMVETIEQAPKKK